MIMGKQVTNYFYVLIYYLSYVYLLAYIYLNIFYGLMMSNEEESQEANKRESVLELKLNRSSVKRPIGRSLKDIENEENSEKQKE